jgi:hypothetical protein
MYRSFDVTIGGSRLMMHNAQLSDPLNHYAKALKAFTGNRKKSDEDHVEIGRIEFEGGLYFDPDIGPYIPDHWLNAMLVEGARKRKLGKLFEANVSVAEERHALQYAGPRTVEALWASGKFADRRGVVIGQAKTMRTRPLFRDWKVSFRVQLLECELNADEIETAVLNAGPYGIGDGRPMLAGKFALVSFHEVA